jgi:hypothetical protein
MPSITNNGGSIGPRGGPVAAVATATATRIAAGAETTWVVTLVAPPPRANYTLGQDLIYNSRGTHNPNADNALTVESVIGPAKYKCSGPWPGPN